MSRLNKRLDELSSLLKQFNASIEMPKPPGIKKPPIPKAPGVAPKSQKDPVKMAEQIANPDIKPMVMDQAKTMKESLKISKSGQWSITKAEDDFTPTEKITPDQKKNVDEFQSVKSFSDAYNRRPEQKELISDIDFGSRKDKLHEEQASGVSGGSGWHRSKKHDKNVWIKSSLGHPNFHERGHDKLSSARREVLFHNMAHDFFNMGDYVPTTAGFSRAGDEHSAQAEVKGGKHVPRSLKDPGPGSKVQLPKEYTETIKKMHDSGDLHKLALMDHVMGHHDRHRGNFMYLPEKKKLHLIDNGTAFDYKNFDVRESPHYWDHAVSDIIDGMGLKGDLHPEAKKWLMDLDTDKAKKLFEEHGHFESDDHARGFLNRLQHAKDLVKSGKYKDLKDLLKQNKYSTGPSWHEEKKKGA